MSKFHILWVSGVYAESVVWAKNEEEAKKKALNDEDEEFERHDSSYTEKNWRIINCEEVKNDFKS